MNPKLSKYKFLSWEYFLKFSFGLWLFSIAVPVLHFTFYIFVLVVIGGVIKRKLTFSAKLEKANFPVYLFGTYLFWMLLTSLYSENRAETFRQIEKMIPQFMLLFLLFVRGYNNYLSFGKFKKWYIWGAL